MSKKVVIISGSPRKGGNSDTLCDKFMDGALASGNQAEKISLRGLTVNFCLACDACKKNGGNCVQKDDMASILEKMIAADVVVLATPVYFYAMAGQVKTLIDRTYPRYGEIKGKDFYVIMTAAENSKEAMRTTLDEFERFINFLPGCSEKGVIYGTGVWARGDILGSKILDEAYNLGKSI